MKPEIPFSETPYIKEYGLLVAVAGSGRVNAQKWPEWARIVAIHGWSRVLRAADFLDGPKRWPPEVESLCRQYQRDEEIAAKEAADKAESDTRRAQQAAIRERAKVDFATIRQKHGV